MPSSTWLGWQHLATFCSGSQILRRYHTVSFETDLRFVCPIGWQGAGKMFHPQGFAVACARQFWDKRKDLIDTNMLWYHDPVRYKKLEIFSGSCFLVSIASSPEAPEGVRSLGFPSRKIFGICPVNKQGLAKEWNPLLIDIDWMFKVHCEDFFGASSFVSRQRL